MNAETAGHAGTATSKLLNTENIEMFRHPKYYKELRKLRNKEARRVLGCLPTNELHNSDQAISLRAHDGERERATGPGHKLQAREDSTANSTRGRVAEPQASSVKLQASEKTSDKRQAPSNKPQASSRKLQAPRFLNQETIEND